MSTQGQAPAPARAARSRVRLLSVVVVLAVVIPLLMGLATAYLVKTYVLQAFFIPAPSMEPALEVGDRVLVNKLSGVERGDIVVFKRPQVLQPPQPTGALKELVKRVVAVGGDTVESRADALHVNGQPVREPYVRASSFGAPVLLQTVPAGHVYVLGDNRTNSSDSRAFGTIDEDSIVGRVFLVWSGGNIRRL